MIKIIGYILILLALIDIIGITKLLIEVIHEFGIMELLECKSQLLKVIYELAGDILVLIFVLSKI